MKRFVSAVLAMTMLFSLLCTTASAVEKESVGKKGSTTITDDFGNRYVVTEEETDDFFIATMTKEDGTLVSRSVLNWETGEIVTESLADQGTTEKSVAATAAASDSDYVISRSSVYDYIVSDGAATAAETRGSSYDSDYNYSYKFRKTGNTDYLYMGQILTGDCYYRCTGYYDESNRMSYAFARDVQLTVIEAAVAWAIGKGPLLVLDLVKNILKEFAIGWAEGKLLEDFNPIVSIRAFDFKFKTTMEYNNRDVSMCIIDRVIEYVYAEVNGRGALTDVDMFSYTSEDQAINAMCSESLGYAAAAFSAKYITQNYPDLSLPVSGPSFTWGV